ncbi:MAG: serine protease [Vicinamibacteria bacterium]
MILLLAAALAAQSPRALTESTFERVKGSLYTVEIHSGNDGARSSLGSGYLVSADGLLVTNYHVVGAYVADPDRYRMRATNHAGASDARLVAFDLVNDLALLQVDPGGSRPLPIARARPAPGAPVVSFGNPEGLGLSLIEGIANGFAEKGLVDRMLLSMPLNSGMSGGPILNAAGEVVGTNVSVMWLSNSLSFGVPAEKIAPLLARPPLAIDEASLRAETARQLAAVEQATVARVLAPGTGEVTVGGALSRRPGDVFECWDGSETDAEAGIAKASYACNLQFTPSIEAVGEIASVELLIEHFAAGAPAAGFYGWLEQHAGEHIETEALDPGNGVFSAPRCLADRVRAGGLTWKVNTCASAYVSYPGYFDFDLTATTLTRPREAAFVSLHGKGLTSPSFAALLRRFLGDVRFAEAAR